MELSTADTEKKLIVEIFTTQWLLHMHNNLSGPTKHSAIERFPLVGDIVTRGSVYFDHLSHPSKCLGSGEVDRVERFHCGWCQEAQEYERHTLGTLCGENDDDSPLR